MSRLTAAGRRAGVLALLTALLLGQAGCAQLTDVHERSLIFGLGLDTGSQPGTVLVTSQAMHPTGASAGGGAAAGGSGGGSAEWKTLVASGRTFNEALGRLQGQTDRQVYLAQLAEIFLGSPLARQGVLHDMDALLRSTEVAENVPVAVVQGPAAAFLQNGTKQQVAWKVRRFLVQPRTGQAVLTNPFWHFMAQSLAPAGATYATAFAPAPEAEGFQFAGTAIFLGGRLVDTLSPAESDALAWVIKREDFGGVTVGSDDEDLHVAIQGIRTRWDLREPTTPVLHVTATGQIANSPDHSLADHSSGMTQAAEREMTLEIEDVLNRLRADGADLLGLRERLREQGTLPPGPWPENFRSLRLGVVVQLHLVAGKVR